jgi:phosphate starvation-inducible protein PhoH and related proteins
MGSKATQASAFHFKARTPRQQKAYDLYKRTDLLFLLGPAGTGKTTVAMACALNDILNSSSPRKQIVLTRPAISLAGEDMGFIPGDVAEKYEPYLVPFRQAIQKLVYKFPDDLLSPQPLAYVRGVTWENSIIIVDEAQNLNWHKLKAVVTRLGQGSKMLVLGDPQQSDIRPRDSDYFCDLEEFVDKLEVSRIFPDVGVVDFFPEDCQRHGLVARILGVLE